MCVYVCLFTHITRSATITDLVGTTAVLSQFWFWFWFWLESRSQFWFWFWLESRSQFWFWF